MRKLSFLSFIFIFFLNHLYAEDSQFFGIAGYRVGPYAAGGTPFFTGYIDYLKLLNERDGGLNKVNITWEECEFEYNTAKGLECYERLKTRGKTGPTAIHPMSTGVTYGLMDRAPKDEIPLITLGYGRTDATDGRVFPWVFPLVTNYWSQASAIIEFINQKAKDGIDGKKIVLLYHDSAYGKEPHNVIEQESKKSERVFDEKVQLFREIMDITRDMLLDGKISKEEINKLPFPLIRLQMLANDETITSFALVNQKLNEIYAEEDDDDVLIPEDSKRELFQLLSKFASQCRLDLGISDRDVKEELVQNAVETIANTGKKGRDTSKMSFNGKEFAKNRYVWEVLNNHINDNPNMTLTDFAELLPRDGGDEFKTAGIRRTGTYDTWKKYDEAIEVLNFDFSFGRERRGRRSLP